MFSDGLSMKPYAAAQWFEKMGFDPKVERYRYQRAFEEAGWPKYLIRSFMINNTDSPTYVRAKTMVAWRLITHFNIKEGTHRFNAVPVDSFH